MLHYGNKFILQMYLTWIYIWVLFMELCLYNEICTFLYSFNFFPFCTLNTQWLTWFFMKICMYCIEVLIIFFRSWLQTKTWVPKTSYTVTLQRTNFIPTKKWKYLYLIMKLLKKITYKKKEILYTFFGLGLIDSLSYSGLFLTCLSRSTFFKIMF